MSTHSEPEAHPPAAGAGTSKRGRIIYGAIALPLIAALVWVVRANGNETGGNQSQGNVRDVPVQDGKLIRFSPAFAARVGLSTVPVRTQSLKPLVNVTGTVTYDLRKFAAVGARIAGRVRRVFKVTGDQVKPHEILAELESAELGRAESMVLGARAKELAASAHMTREKRLVEARVTALREAEVATAEFEALRAERVAAERSVQALGGDLQGEVGILMLRSPIAGKIVESKVSRGQTVEPSDTAYQIADLGTLWVELRVFEMDLVAVRVDDEVDIVTQNGASKTLQGRVAHVGDVIDVETRSAAIRVVVDNSEGLLRPGQSVHARIHTAAATGKLPSVPRVAITRIDGKPTVFVLVEKGAVEPRNVKVGSEDADNTTIADGVKEGELVVVGGMFALKSEIFR